MRPLPTLRQLRYLVALAEHKHFGRAAEACFATQSTLSAGLQELENLLDVKLVDEVIEVSDDDAINTTRQLSRDTGLLVGISRLSRNWLLARIDFF